MLSREDYLRTRPKKSVTSTKQTRVSPAVSSESVNMPEYLTHAESSSLQQQQDAVNSMPSSLSMKSNGLYKTELCHSFEETNFCKYGDKCKFAHSKTELRRVSRHPKYKTDLCKTFHTIGTCPYGTRCHFIHNLDEASRDSYYSFSEETQAKNHRLSNCSLVDSNFSALQETQNLFLNGVVEDLPEITLDSPPASASSASSASSATFTAHHHRAASCPSWIRPCDPLEESPSSELVDSVHVTVIPSSSLYQACEEDPCAEIVDTINGCQSDLLSDASQQQFSHEFLEASFDVSRIGATLDHELDSSHLTACLSISDLQISPASSLAAVSASEIGADPKKRLPFFMNLSHVS